MQQRVTETFRQQKPHFGSNRGQSNKKHQEPEQLGAHGIAAVTNYNISEEERMLRSFDLATEYGPCTGMTRLERWQRAEKFGLNPPLEIKQMLTGPNGEQWNQCLWEGRL